VEIIRLVDRVGADSLISNGLFENVVLVGPAVIAPLENVRLQECSFDAPPDVLFIEVPEGKQVVGVIGIRNSTFRKCEFRNIAIIGASDAIESMRKELRPAEQPATPPPAEVEAPPEAEAAEASEEAPAEQHST